MNQIFSVNEFWKNLDFLTFEEKCASREKLTLCALKDYIKIQMIFGG